MSAEGRQLSTWLLWVFPHQNSLQQPEPGKVSLPGFQCKHSPDRGCFIGVLKPLVRCGFFYFLGIRLNCLYLPTIASLFSSSSAFYIMACLSSDILHVQNTVHTLPSIELSSSLHELVCFCQLSLLNCPHVFLHIPFISSYF